MPTGGLALGALALTAALVPLVIPSFQATDLAPDHWRFYGGLTWWIKR